MSVCCVLIHLINGTLKWIPFNLVMVPAILFYFAPDSVLGEIIYEWQKTDVSGKIFIVRMYLELTFVCAFVMVFLKYLCSDAFMPGKCVNKNKGGCNE
ncbi:hypothetical protein FEK50_21870 [Escherichia sp. E2586]|uniref:hypothetical protein n=2 Tax=Escherichia TaxID=561 RepID=UPI001037630E|nr:hypothetical protein [Escherichia sp. E2586]TBR67237.1 hypothetical protein D9737_11500 [Escherichia sp. E10V4]TGC04081.1 hypothetical protein CRG92_00425 [Escherichia sp. E2586]TLI64007.1 hypothetical protein FEK50_21870 [Escherichia sp. E2586]